jgi:general transcription factor 3C protein 4
MGCAFSVAFFFVFFFCFVLTVHSARCSITTFILSTPWVRTCVGCSRKAFFPPSAHVRSDGQRDLDQIPRIIAQGGWVVEELLEAVKGCLFCGNRFVSIL